MKILNPSGPQVFDVIFKDVTHLTKGVSAASKSLTFWQNSQMTFASSINHALLRSGRDGKLSSHILVEISEMFLTIEAGSGSS